MLHSNCMNCGKDSLILINGSVRTIINTLFTGASNSDIALVEMTKEFVCSNCNAKIAISYIKEGNTGMFND